MYFGFVRGPVSSSETKYTTCITLFVYSNQANPIRIPQRILDHVINCRLQQVKNIIQPGMTESNEFSGIQHKILKTRSSRY